MLAGGFFAALVHIGAKGTGEREIRPEETQEGKGKTVGGFPPVRRLLRTDGEELFRIPAVEDHTVLPAAAETDIGTAVGVDFKIEIPVILLRHKEEFQTAVLADTGERRGVFRTDVFLHSAEADMEGFGVITEAAEGPDPAVRQPENFGYFQFGNGIPVRGFFRAVDDPGFAIRVHGGFLRDVFPEYGTPKKGRGQCYTIA